MNKSKSRENEGSGENVRRGSIGSNEEVGKPTGKSIGSAEGRTNLSQGNIGSVEGVGSTQQRQKTKSAEDDPVKSREQVQKGSMEDDAKKIREKAESVVKKAEERKRETGVQKGMQQEPRRAAMSRPSVSESRGKTFTSSMTSAGSARRSKNVSFEEYPYDERTIASQRGHNSLSDESIISEEIEVIITGEHRDYVEKVTIGKLSRAGLGQSFKWTKLAYYCVVISYALSLDTIAMFNYCVIRMGMYWLIPFLISMYCIGFPLTYLELALGQYTHSSFVTVFNRIAPVSVGVAVSSVFLVIASLVIGNDFLEINIWLLYEAINIFIQELPFNCCVEQTSRSYCHSQDRDCSLIRNPMTKATHSENPTSLNMFSYMPIGDTCVLNAIKSWDEGYKENTMNVTGLVNRLPIIHYTLSDFDNFESLKQNVWPLPIDMATTIGMFCFMAFLLSYRRRYIAIIAYVYVTLIFVVTISIVVVYTYLAPPKYPASQVFDADLKILNTETWTAAIIMTCLVLKLGYGGMVFLGSQNQFHNDLVTDAMVITVAVSFIYMSQAMLHALVRDSFILEAHSGDFQAFNSTGFPVNAMNDYNVMSNRAGAKLMSLYIASFKCFGTLHAPMVMLMTIFGVFSAFASKAVRVELIFTTVMDYIGFVPARETRTTLMYLICLLIALTSLITYCPDCYTYEISMETIVIPNAAMIIILGELFVVCGLYGTRRFFNNVSTMTMGKASSIRAPVGGVDQFINMITMLLWKAVIPVAILFSLIMYFDSSADSADIDAYEDVMLVFLLSPIPLCAIYKFLYSYFHRMNYWRLFMPDAELWGPRALGHRELAERNEKLVRN